jgi:transposase, IS5 family
VPADIKYPTDLGLLNEAREQTEEIIDILYEELDENENKKPRTYRNTARKEYLNVAKKRRPSKKQRVLQYLLCLTNS